MLAPDWGAITQYFVTSGVNGDDCTRTCTLTSVPDPGAVHGKGAMVVIVSPGEAPLGKRRCGLEELALGNEAAAARRSSIGKRMGPPLPQPPSPLPFQAHLAQCPLRELSLSGPRKHSVFKTGDTGPSVPGP